MLRKTGEKIHHSPPYCPTSPHGEVLWRARIALPCRQIFHSPVSPHRPSGCCARLWIERIVYRNTPGSKSLNRSEFHQHKVPSHHTPFAETLTLFPS